MIHFFYDADSEMNLVKAREYGIDNEKYFIKMPYSICGENHPCELITPELSKDFFDKVRAGNMPSTSALNSEEYKEIFEPAFKEGGEILYVSFSSAMSATFDHLEVALKDLKSRYPDVKFTRYDTKAISMGTGIAVIAAAKYIQSGKSVAETVAMLDELVPHINITIVADDLNYLKRGGRLTAVKALFGTTSSVAGRNKALMTVVSEIANGAQRLDEYPVVIMNADCRAEAERVADRIKAQLPSADVWICDVGPVIGTHCGPGTIGICYVGAERPEPIKD